MKVFISWSGETSKNVAAVIRDWLPTVLQTVKPYFTPSDIEKGARWSAEIASELDSSVAGIFCVTRENINSQWLMFEAGAISKKVDQALVCPILLGLENSDIKGPLTQFQTTLFEKAEFRKLVTTLNTANVANVLEDSVLQMVFEKFWPDLEERVSTILSRDRAANENGAALRSEREILEEILDLSRSLAIQKAGGFKAHNELNQLISEFMISFELVFDSDWDFTESCIEDGSYINGTFIDPQVEDERNNWGNRGGLLKAYRALVDYIKKNGIDIDISYRHS